MIKIIKKVSALLILFLLTTTLTYATDINMNLQENNVASNSISSNSISNSSTYTTTVSGQNTNNSSNSEELGIGNILNILLIVVGVVLILLGIAILIRIHGK